METDRLIGKILDGRYKILELLGSGGMGTVYKSREIALERFIALKILKNSDMSEEDQARFEREGKIVSELAHQNIVSFYRFGFAPDGTPYIAMECLQGGTLRDLFNSEGQLNWHRIGKIVVQICHALEFTHSHSIVHRDLKPENIMLLDAPSPETVKLLDFGLATFMPAAVESYQKITTTGQLVGSVNYISPEQCAGKIVDHRADIYALGCILYEAVSGRLPHQADNPLGVVYKHVNAVPDKFGSFLEFHSIPLAFEKIVFRALDRDPEKRYASAAELRFELEQLMLDPAATLTLALAGLVKAETVEEEKKRRLKPVFLITALALCLIVFVVAFGYRSTLSQRAAKASKDFQPRSDDGIRIRNWQIRLQMAEKNLPRYQKQLEATPVTSPDRRRAERQVILTLLEMCVLSYHISDHKKAQRYYAMLEPFLGNVLFDEPYVADKLGETQFKTGRFAAAKQTYMRTFKARSANGVPGADNLMRIGMCELVLGDPSSARRYFAQAKEAWQPYLVSAVPTKLLGRSRGIDPVYMAERRAASNSTDSFFRQTIELKISDPEKKVQVVALLNDLAQFLLELGNSNDRMPWPLQQAREWLKRTPKETPGYAAEARRTYELSAECSRLRGRNAEADEFERILKIQLDPAAAKNQSSTVP